MRPRRPVGGAQSGRLAITIVIIFGLAVVVVFAMAMFGPYGNGRHPHSPQDPHDVVEIIGTDGQGTGQDPQPPVSVPLSAPKPASTPALPATVTPPPITPPPLPETPPAYVGRADWHVYHRPTCKYAKRIKSDNLVEFSSVTEAKEAGYIPCRICKPPGAPEVASSTSRPPTTPRVPRRPAKRPKPVTFKTVPLTFPYKVAERDARNEDGIQRVDYTVDVERPLSRDEALSLAKNLVTRETSKTVVNAMSFVIRRTVTRNQPKWVIWIDWAPYGHITEAGHVEPGDYRTHQFYIVLEGIQ